MKKSCRAAIAGIWIAGAAIFLTRLWLTRPEMFPDFPKPVAEYLVRLYGAGNAEEIADLEILIGLILSVPFVAALTLLGWLLWHRIKGMGDTP